MTPPNPAPMTDHAGLVARLRVAAKECEREGVNGWGNSMAAAADALEQAGGPCEDIERAAVVDRIRVETENAGGPSALARKWNVSASCISAICLGTANPGSAVLRHIGLRRVMVYRVLNGRAWARREGR